MKKINNALSNKVFYDNKKHLIIKKISKDKFKKKFGNNEIIVLKKMNFNFNVIKNKIKIKYIDHKPFDNSNISIEDIEHVANAIKKMHKIKIKNSNLKIAGFENAYKNFLLKGNGSKKNYINKEEKFISEKALKILKTGNQVLLHNDLVEGNLLKNNKKIILIDFEYSGIGNKIFDIASFLTERNLTKEQISIFIQNLDKNINYQNLMFVCGFLQIFWARWALFKYKKTKNNIYKEIAKEKIKKYKIICKNLFVI